MVRNQKITGNQPVINNRYEIDNLRANKVSIYLHKRFLTTLPPTQ